MSTNTVNISYILFIVALFSHGVAFAVEQSADENTGHGIDRKNERYHLADQRDAEKDRLLDRFYFNLGVTSVDISATSSEFLLERIGPATTLAIDEGPVSGSGADVVGDTRPTLNIGYSFKRYPRLSLETAVAPPFEFDLKLTGTARNESLAPFALCPTSDTSSCLATGIPALGENLGDTQVLPVLLTLVYQLPPMGRFEPYAGIGLTYVYTFDAEVTNTVLTENNRKPDLEISNSFGGVLQLGAKARLTKEISLVADVKYISGVSQSASLNNIELNSPTLGDVIGPSTVDEASLDVELQSTVINLSLQYRF